MASAPLPESDIDDDGAAEATGKRLTEAHDRALRRFDSVATPQQELRAQALEQRRFVTIAGAQWEGSWGEQNVNAPQPEVDKITKGLEKIETDYRENRLTVDFLPATDGANDDTADTLDGMHRADSHQFKAQQARDNAFQEGIRGGFGAWRLTTDYADPMDPERDEQRINPGMVIVDADQSVYFDGASKLYDKSDARWAFIISAEPREREDDRSTRKKQARDGGGRFGPGLKYAFDWFTPDVVYTAEYYEIEENADKLLTFTQTLSGETQRYYESEIDQSAVRELKAQGWKMVTRAVKRPRVHKYILNGERVVKDCGYIAGPNIPIVPFYGRRDFVDNMERFRGHVAKKMDRQRIYNSAMAKVVETNSLSPARTPILYDDEMTPQISEEWGRRNIDRLAYMRRLRTFAPDGTPIASPIQYLEPPDLPPATVGMLQVASADLTDEDDTTDQVKANTSADAMDIAASRVDAKSGIYLDNMRQSLQREGEIYLGMWPEIYGEPGRKVQTMTADGKDGTATIAEPFMDANQVYRIRNDIQPGQYKVVADVQESTATKRQKTVRQNVMLADIAAKVQDVELGQAALLTAVMNQDGEGMEDMQGYARNKLIALGVVKPTPEEQQQMEQAKAAQGAEQPSPADQALLAAAKDKEASATQRLADAHLKAAQAEAVGGPDAVPQTPTGLHPVTTAADAADKLAGADLKTAQAEHLRHMTVVKAHEAHTKRIATGRELSLKERAQDHIENQPQEPAQ